MEKVEGKGRKKQYWNRGNITKLASVIFPKSKGEQVVLIGKFDNPEAEEVSEMFYIHPRDVDGAIELANKIAPDGEYDENLFVAIPITDLPRSAVTEELIDIQENLDKSNGVNTVWATEPKPTGEHTEEQPEERDEVLEEWEAGWDTDENVERRLQALPTDDFSGAQEPPTLSRNHNVPYYTLDTDDPLNID